MTELDPKWIRVSSILSMIPAKDAEGRWHYPMQAIDQEVLQRKADLGSSVHAAIAAHCRDEFIPISPKEEGYLESYLKWEKDVKLEPISNEERFYHNAMNLTGCVDMLARFKGLDKVYLIDFKCTVASDPVKWPVQGALYKLLADVTLMDFKVEKTVLFVQLDPNGQMPKVHKYTITDTLMAAAVSWYNAYNYLMGKK